MKSLGSFSPQKVAVMMLSPDCNMTCEFCVINENFQGFSLQEAQTLIQDLPKRGYDTLILGGGEPTLWPYNVFDLAKFAKKQGLFVQIGTNAIKLPADFEKIESIDRWILPLESLNPTTHNLIRHYKKKHHSIMMETLDKLKSNQKSIIISTVLTQINVNEILDLHMFIQAYNEPYHHVYSWNLYRFLPLGRGGKVNETQLQIPQQEFDSIIQLLKAKESSFKITVRRNMYNSSKVDFFVFRNGQTVLESS